MFLPICFIFSLFLSFLNLFGLSFWAALLRATRVRAPLAETAYGRDRTMCPCAVRSTEWVRQTRNIIVSTTNRQAGRQLYTTAPLSLFLSIPFYYGGGVSVLHGSPTVCAQRAIHTHATPGIRGLPTLAEQRERRKIEIYMNLCCDES